MNTIKQIELLFIVNVTLMSRNLIKLKYNFWYYINYILSSYVYYCLYFIKIEYTVNLQIYNIDKM